MIYTYTCVREDAFILYGFLTKDDLWFFKKLITVNGIGPKGALGILSTLSTDDLRFAIIAGDAKTIAKSPGIGNKSAERIILDLKDKISKYYEDNSGNCFVSPDLSVSTGLNDELNTAKNESIEAMVALGYSASQAMKAVNRVTADNTDISDAGVILKQALRIVSTL